jgi:hypothetical protein
MSKRALTVTCRGCGHELPKSYFDHPDFCYLCDTVEPVDKPEIMSKATSLYVCLYNGGKLRPLMGPFCTSTAVQMILSRGDIEAQKPYCNASRNELSKKGLYPKNRLGEARLIADMERFRPQFWDDKAGIRCEACRSRNLFHTPGTTGNSTSHGEQDAPGNYRCRDCNHLFND